MKMVLTEHDHAIFTDKRVKSYWNSVSILCTSIALTLHTQNVITVADFQEIDAQITSAEKIQRLRLILEARLNSTDQLISTLQSNDETETVAEDLKELFGEIEKELEHRGQRTKPLLERVAGGLCARVSGSNDHNMTVGIEKLKKCYTSEFSTFKPLSFDDTILELDNIWINLQLDDISDKSVKCTNCISCLQNAFKTNKNVICKGEPGTGKSTLTNYLCYQWAKGKWTDFDIVFFAKLREVGRTSSILDAVSNSLQIYDSIAEFTAILLCFCDQKVLVILDGYDEATECCEELERVLDDSKRGLKFHLLITSRPWAIEDKCCCARRIVITPLTPKLQFKYIRNHFAHDLTTAQCLIEKLNDNSVLRNLTETALMLSYVCFYFATNENKQIDSIGALYVHLVGYLIARQLQKEKRPKYSLGQDWMTSSIVLNLGKLSVWGLRRNQTLIFSADELRHADVDISFLTDSGLLVKDMRRKVASESEAIYSLPHQTMQGFLAALYNAKRYAEADFHRLTEQNFGQQIVAKSDESLSYLEPNFTASDLSMVSAMERPNLLVGAVVAFLDTNNPHSHAYAVSKIWQIPNYKSVVDSVTKQGTDNKIKELFGKFLHHAITDRLQHRRARGVGEFLPLTVVCEYPIQRIKNSNYFYFPTLRILVFSSKVKGLSECQETDSNEVPYFIDRVILESPSKKQFRTFLKNSVYTVSAIQRIVTHNSPTFILKSPDSNPMTPRSPIFAQEKQKQLSIRELRLCGDKVCDLLTNLNLTIRQNVNELSLEWSFSCNMSSLFKRYSHLTWFTFKLGTDLTFISLCLLLPKLTLITSIEFTDRLYRIPDQTELRKFQEALERMPKLETVKYKQKTFTKCDIEQLVQKIVQNVNVH